jgi:short-subunit dehydrogenase
MANTLIIGATSAIASEVGRILAARGDRLVLIGRNTERLELTAKDLRVRGAVEVETLLLDVDDLDRHQQVIEAACDHLGSIDTALVAHGTLPDQSRCEADTDEALRQIHTNGVATCSLVLHLANRLEGQGRGTLAVITSVAGDRGRRSNYVYGASKKLVSTLLDGLRIRLAGAGVEVVDIRPGFVDTPMTAQLDKGALWAQPERVAADIVSAVDAGTPQAYTPGFWRPVMAVIRALPRPVFRRLPL